MPWVKLVAGLAQYHISAAKRQHCACLGAPFCRGAHKRAGRGVGLAAGRHPCHRDFVLQAGRRRDGQMVLWAGSALKGCRCWCSPAPASACGLAQLVFTPNPTSRTLVPGFRPDSIASGARDTIITLCPPPTGRAVKCHSLNAPAPPEAVACTVLAPTARTLVSLGAVGPAGGGGLQTGAGMGRER